MFLKQAEKAIFNTPEAVVTVKGGLKKCIAFWEKNCSSVFILDVIKLCYKLPFLTTPRPAIFKNNRSAVENYQFVSETIDDLVLFGSIIEVPFIPTVVNPLSVAISSSNKKRLVLDLRYVNRHLYKEYIKFDDWRSFQHFIKPDSYMYKFDLKKGYHIDIFSDHQMFLGFSWTKDDKEHYYVFTVLPFCLSSAPCLSTKIMRQLLQMWHHAGVQICVFIDDGAGVNQNYHQAVQDSLLVPQTLIQSGFVANEEKSIWHPQKESTWLVITVNFVRNIFFISVQRITSLLNSINRMLSSPYTTARRVSVIAGNIVSLKFVFSNLILLKTRFLYNMIDCAFSWDSRINTLAFPEAHRELLFWRDNVIRLNNRSIIQVNVLNTVIFSDASDNGTGGISLNGELICHKQFNTFEKSMSSTWRELEGIRFALTSLVSKLKHSRVNVKTDNYAASIIVERGSNKTHLQRLAVSIFEICKHNSIDISVKWIPRNYNKEADRLSKYVDRDDWEITQEAFQYLNSIWGPFSIDRFANYNNTKCDRFNSNFMFLERRQ